MINTAEITTSQTLTHAQYPSYKDSRVEWLGEIPAHWKLIKLKYEAVVVLGKMLCNTDQGNYSYKPYLKSKNIQWLRVDISSVDEMWFSQKELGQYRLKWGDLILSEGGEVGKTCIWRNELNECYIQNSAHKVTVHQTNSPEFLLYVFFTYGKIGLFDAIVNRVSIAHLTRDKLINVEIPLPPLPEQTRIAEFLDRKTAQIDRAIAQKERLIELLNERRQATIHKAVTRGLNPNVPMKDSGIDWINEIPTHWEVSRINWLFTEKDETGYPDLPLLIVSINTGVTLRDMDDDENRRQLAENFNVYKRTLAGDIAFNKMRMWQGAVGVVPQDGLVSPDYVVARPNDFVNSAYYGFLFKTREYLAEFIKHSHGIAWDRNRLYWEDFKTIIAIVPPLNEQNQIVDFLNNQQKEIGIATKMVQHQIQKLQELKSTLINSAVTGKIKV